MARPDMNPRTCIATRKEKTPDEMVRFVLDGQGNVTPDLQRKLPGRGVWVSARHCDVDLAVKQGLYSRGFRKAVTADQGLPELVDRLLEQQALGLLALARKSGALVSSRSKVETMIRSGAASVVVHCQGASGDGRQKIDRLIGHLEEPVSVFEAFDGEALDKVTGGGNTVHLAIADSGIADKVAQALEKLVAYRSS